MADKAGWQINEGKLKDNANSNLLAVVSSSILAGKHTTTYKYGLLKSILDNVYNVNDDKEISFDKLAETFTSIYWNMINVYNIPQMTSYMTGARSSFEKLIEKTVEEKPYLKGRFYDSISEKEQKLISKRTYNEFSKYVVGAFYDDTDGLIYGFSKKQKKIWFNNKSLSFLREHKMVLEQVNYYNWLKNVETILKSNKQSIDNLSTILECITKRQSLDQYKKELINLGEKEVCFYCGKELKGIKHLDHVIPWDFIRNDDLWNFVFACKTCNSSKNNKVPNKDYIKKLKERNKALKLSCPDIDSLVKDASLNGFSIDWKPHK